MIVPPTLMMSQQRRNEDHYPKPRTEEERKEQLELTTHLLTLQVESNRKQARWLARFWISVAIINLCLILGAATKWLVS